MSWYNPLSWNNHLAKPTAPRKSPTGLTGLNGKPVAAPKTVNQNAWPGIVQGVQNGGLTVPGYNPSSGNYQGGPSSSAGYGTSGYGSSGSSSYAAPPPDTTALQNGVRNRISAIQNAYAALSGAIDPVLQQRVADYQHQYDTQTTDLNNSYKTTTNQQTGILGAKGLGDSSFLGNALDDSKGVYNSNLDSINQDRTSKLAAIGQFGATTKANADAASQSYNQYLPHLGEYSGDQLKGLDSQLAGALPGIQAQAAGIGTDQGFINQLAQWAPAVNNGASQLSAKLQQLATSAAPGFAKKQIAAGLVKSANLTDQNAQNYYTDYFDKLLSGQGA